MKSTCYLELILYLVCNNINLKALIMTLDGQDSIMLMYLLSFINIINQENIFIVHFNHQWRKDSKINVNYCCFYSQFIIEDEDLARKWRYKALLNLANNINYNKIYTAHTINDRLETLIYNLCKGTGLDGYISSIAPLSFNKQKINIIRPLFNFYRIEIYWLCRKLYIPLWTDNTNCSYNKSRNKIRNELFPYLRNFINPKLDVEMAKFLSIICYETEYLQLKACFFFKLLLNHKRMAIEKVMFTLLHPSLKRRIIQLLLLKLGVKSFDLSLIDYISSQSNTMNKTLKINDNICFFIGLNWIYVIRNKKPDNITIIM
uniref:tRNA(Ile)-lysidine synthase n=1 Tax=Porphyridium aerugineum TaxID=2792 RepID=UPI001FCD1B25|nr:tRNA(Ile)-lysidine synthase [Porphyridium aerugineum]UNJ17852.1 tRNA(Ile)-lysidine synthase [Porphyridium aerugineum]